MKTMTKSQIISAAMSGCIVKWMPSHKIEELAYSYLTKRVLVKRLFDEKWHPIQLKRNYYFCEIVPMKQSVSIGELLM